MTALTKNPEITHAPVNFQLVPLAPTLTFTSTLAISGWISQSDDPKEKWAGLKCDQLYSNIFNFTWESGGLIETVCRNMGVGAGSGAAAAVGKLALSTWRAGGKLFAPIAAGGALGPIGIALATFAGTEAITFISDFKSGCHQSKFAGMQLARLIKNQGFGQGPVNIVAFSLGCRVAYYVCKELARIAPGKRLIHHLLLLGGAAKNDPAKWDIALGCVAGRAINVYSQHDSVLYWLYQVVMFHQPAPIGLGPIRSDRFENFDATSYIGGHLEHRTRLSETLIRVRLQL